jgi:DNA repair protein RecN (Recombination protein N)
MTLDLADGFTVLTGETGAGKSILIDALQLALGSRSDTTVIREGASRTEVCAEFDCPAACIQWLEEAGFDSADSLLLRRTIDTQGKSRAWINGSAATATQLREVGDFLLDIHGQHAWQSLIRPEAIRHLLDAYAGIETSTLESLWQEWRKAQKVLIDARTAQDALSNEHERLSWHISELEKLAPGKDEWEELNATHSRLANAQSLIDAAHTALAALEGDETGALIHLSRATNTLAAQVQFEAGFRDISEVLHACLAQAEDAVYSLHAYLRRTNPDPERLAALDERMTLWISLSRRYKRAPGELSDLLAQWREEIVRIDTAKNLAGLEYAEQVAAEAYKTEAYRLSKLRKLAAPHLSKAVTTAMQELGMQGGRFEVSLQIAAQPTQSGLEDVLFLVAGHAGSTPRPVGKVASGGELSRIALAIAVTTSQLGSAQTLIFDEVDSGVGGAVADTVGRLMRQLGRDRQVLAVTHLPQVASCADHHLVVAKQFEGNVTISTVKQVQGEQRVSEVARMLGGGHISETTLAHAREMIEGGRTHARLEESA